MNIPQKSSSQLDQNASITFIHNPSEQLPLEFSQ